MKKKSTIKEQPVKKGSKAEQQLEELNDRLGKGVGAEKERAKLNRLIDKGHSKNEK